MNLFDYLIPFAIALGVLIVFHELGHYLVARLCGVKVLRFSVGFGKPLVSRRYGADRTEWALAAFPLGGYVKMLDEREGEVPAAELHRAFNRQTVGKRFAIVAAGPIANLLLAVVLYWGLFVHGSEELKAIVAQPVAESAAARAGLRAGDTVVSVAGDDVRSWQELRWAMLQHALDGSQVGIGVIPEGGRNAELRTLSMAGASLEAEAGDVLDQLGLHPLRPPIAPVIGRLIDDAAADLAGIRVGDRVVAIDGEPIEQWSQLVETVVASEGRTLSVRVERDGLPLVLAVTPQLEQAGGRSVARIGVAVANDPGLRQRMFSTVRYGVVDALGKAFQQTWETSVLSVSVIGRMILGDVSWKNLSGPVTIADFAGQSAKMGVAHYLKFLALISISLGVLNLLPIPVLDGGHLLYYLVEIVKGSPVPDRIMEIGQQVGLALLVMLMAFAFYNDINRLISG
ncbi:MAG: RIP metalloprotease RseP [Zoogloeaceae bacterium]|nr:RIP metalloprotease RseP [Rhodocyclaceae bacterium]MCP5236176.1 RIP metalloprotease RseP [Zoogloeaceae bacterium]